MSKLIVEVCRVDNIEDLQNADKLQLATVKGWQCLVSKGQYKVGEPVIFVPPDAMIPQTLVEELKLEFLRDNGRVKTIKLRGYISQGLILSLDCLKGHIVRDGDDVADKLKITKYEPTIKSIIRPRETLNSLWIKYISKDITLRRFVAKSIGIIYDRYFKPRKLTNPNFKEYTDIQNQKHYPTLFQEGEEVVITEKIHGTNFRAACLYRNPSLIDKWFHLTPPYEFVYGSHTVQKMPMSGPGFYGEDVYGKIAEKYNIKSIIPPGYTIYGEIFGENKPGTAIQKGFGYGVEGIEVRFFDVKKGDKYLSWDDFKYFCEDRSLPIVPVLYKGPFSIEKLKECTNGNTTVKSIFTKDFGHREEVSIDQIREGCVVKPVVETYDNRAGRKILKSISAEYLLLQHKTKADENTEYQH
jgi:tRNA-binding EMAP/Myf-like protein